MLKLIQEKPLNGSLALCLCVAVVLLFSLTAAAKPPQREYYEIRVYHVKDAAQEGIVDQYLQQAFIPALHKAGISKVGVFKPVGNDTAADRRVYVLVPYRSLDQFVQLPRQLEADKQHAAAGAPYIEAAYNAAPYTRMETILLQAFTGQPQSQLPALTGPKAARIYELRSYEGPTEKLYRNKVQMFNKGDEVGLFKRLGFNAVFYGEVLSGSRMPNLMYMTTFDNKASRDEHWKAFSSDPSWKQLLAMPEYQHNVSRSEIIFLYPAEYSDI
jgi:NIPSNAP